MERKSINTIDDSEKKSVGRKSDKTRRRIMEATKALISQGKYTAKITDIARAANIAQPHFYIYFSSVQDVVYAISEEIYETANEGFKIPADTDWNSEQGFLIVRAAVEAGFAKWKENYAINSIGQLLSDKEDGRFRKLRIGRFQAISKIFVEKIREAQQQGRLHPSINASLRAHQCVNVLANMAQHYDSFISCGYSHQQVIDDCTHLLINLVGFSTKF
ncbi:MAG: TetR/AcrR family transcriptional regulator [Spongiibacteraceae bacterium]